MAKHSYLFACIVYWILTLVLFVGWYDGQTALSFIASSGVAPYILFLVTVLVVTTLVMIFLRGFFFQHVNADTRFRRAYYIAYALLVLVALVPSVEGPALVLHRFFAFGAALVSAYIFYKLVVNKSIKVWLRRYIATCTLAGLAAISVSQSVQAEIFSFLLAQSCVVLVTYVSLEPKI